jgi:murein DD-endopeptidase MepM/ murein hydrolase activator NlpD
MRIDLARVVDTIVDRKTVAVAVGLSMVAFAGALCALDAARRSAESEAAWLRQRLGEKRTLVRALQTDLADVAAATDRVSQMASLARQQNVQVRLLVQVEDAHAAPYTPARLAALDDATLHRSDDGARAMAELAFMEEQLAATTDSLSLMTALANAPRPGGAAPAGARPPVVARAERATVRPAVLDATTPGGWPVAGQVSSRFGYRESPYGRGTERHTGLDIRAEYGTPVRVSAPGVVVFAGRDSGGYGSTVVVDHGGDVKTLYGHLSGIYVREGQHIARSTVIGAVGNTGRATGVHLHYEVRIDNVPVDPMRYVQSDGIQQVASTARYAGSR